MIERRGEEIYVFEEEENECEKYRRKFFIICVSYK